jgi:hypothetical protein
MPQIKRTSFFTVMYNRYPVEFHIAYRSTFRPIYNYCIKICVMLHKFLEKCDFLHLSVRPTCPIKPILRVFKWVATNVFHGRSCTIEQVIVHMSTNISEECIISIFRVENQPSKKPMCSRWLEKSQPAGIPFI